MAPLILLRLLQKYVQLTKKALLHICPLKRLNAVFFSLSVCLSTERAQKAAAAANIIYLGGRICTLCQWTAPGLLCASIHYRHKALDVSPLHLFPALSTRHTSSVRTLGAVDACRSGRWSNGEECQRMGGRGCRWWINKLRLLCGIFGRSWQVRASLGKPEFNSPNSAGVVFLRFANVSFLFFLRGYTAEQI